MITYVAGDPKRKRWGSLLGNGNNGNKGDST